MSTDTSQAFLAEAVKVLRRNHKKIRHCLDQLTDDHVNWRPFESQNSIANLILHLCGNLRQWIIAGLPVNPDTRNRAAEFADRARYSKEDLLARFDRTVDEVQRTLETFPPDRLLEQRRIQGFEETPLTATFHALAHLEGHTHEIVYITRFLIRDQYRFLFVPKTNEQGAPP